MRKKSLYRSLSLVVGIVVSEFPSLWFDPVGLHSFVGEADVAEEEDVCACIL